MSELVRQRHENHPAYARLNILLGDIRLAGLENKFELIEKSLEKTINRHALRFDTQCFR